MSSSSGKKYLHKTTIVFSIRRQLRGGVSKTIEESTVANVQVSKRLESIINSTYSKEGTDKVRRDREE